MTKEAAGMMTKEAAGHDDKGCWDAKNWQEDILQLMTPASCLEGCSCINCGLKAVCHQPRTPLGLPEPALPPRKKRAMAASSHQAASSRQAASSHQAASSQQAASSHQASGSRQQMHLQDYQGDDMVDRMGEEDWDELYYEIRNVP